MIFIDSFQIGPSSKLKCIEAVTTTAAPKNVVALTSSIAFVGIGRFVFVALKGFGYAFELHYLATSELKAFECALV